MRIKGAKQVHYDSGPNMTPLVDVVMVILIFLMLAGSFGANTHYLTSKSVKQGGGAPAEPPPGTIPDETFEVPILIDQSYGFRVRAGDIDTQGQVPDRDWLIGKFKAKMDKYQKANTPIDNIQVVLAPSVNVKYEQIATVYEAAIAAKFTKIAFKTAQ